MRANVVYYNYKEKKRLPMSFTAYIKHSIKHEEVVIEVQKSSISYRIQRT